MPVHFSRCEHRCRSGPSSRCGIGTAVKLRLRVVFGLQALQRCSGLLNRKARGSAVATHHFRIRGEIIIILRFERRVCRLVTVR